jgi:hypothetical protein
MVAADSHSGIIPLAVLIARVPTVHMLRTVRRNAEPAEWDMLKVEELLRRISL